MSNVRPTEILFEGARPRCSIKVACVEAWLVAEIGLRLESVTEERVGRYFSGERYGICTDLPKDSSWIGYSQ